MFKYASLIVFVVFMGAGLRAESDLRSVSSAAMTAISGEVDENDIRGWESHQLLDEVVVKIYTVDGDVFEVHCEETCQKADQHKFTLSQSDDPRITLGFLERGRDAAFSKWEKSRQGGQVPDFGALNGYKTWVYEDTGHGHDHGLTLWTQMIFEKMNVFVMCHLHAGETELVCHYRQSPGHEEHEEHGEHEEHEEHHHHKH